MTDPILIAGLDLAVKRDTSALVVVYYDPQVEQVREWGHCIWEPPVDLEQQVEPALFRLFETQRVAMLMYDPYQFATTEQKLRVKGWGAKLMEINQQTMMTLCANTLHQRLAAGTLALVQCSQLRSHFSWCNAQNTERGWRIVKQKQSRPIDAVVALAMADWGATGEVGHALHPALYTAKHQGRSLADLEIA